MQKFFLAVTLAAHVHTPPISLHDRWFEANTRHGGHLFAATQARILRNQHVTLPIPRSNIRNVVAVELSNTRRYHLSVHVANAHKSWWQDLWERSWTIWTHFLHALFSRAKLGTLTAISLGDLLIGLVIMVVLGATFRLLFSLQRGGRSNTQYEALAIARNARQLFERACEAALRGDRNAAAHFAFLSVIVSFDLQGIVRDNVSATVGDVRAKLVYEHPDLLAAYDNVARAFTTAAYAQNPVDEVAWNHSRQACVQLLNREVS